MRYRHQSLPVSIPIPIPLPCDTGTRLCFAVAEVAPHAPLSQPPLSLAYIFQARYMCNDVSTSLVTCLHLSSVRAHALSPSLSACPLCDMELHLITGLWVPCDPSTPAGAVCHASPLYLTYLNLLHVLPRMLDLACCIDAQPPIAPSMMLALCLVSCIH